MFPITQPPDEECRVHFGRMHQQKPDEQKHLSSSSCFFFMGTNVKLSQIHQDINPVKTHV